MMGFRASHFLAHAIDLEKIGFHLDKTGDQIHFFSIHRRSLSLYPSAAFDLTVNRDLAPPSRIHVMREIHIIGLGLATLG